MDSLFIALGKGITTFSKTLNLGNGSTWPGHIAIETDKNFIKNLLKKNPRLKLILVAGTNGKTTTSTLIRFLLEKQGLKVFQNESGANLLNGIASTLIANATISGKLPFDAAIFEIDENSLPLVLKELTPTAIVMLDLFRDQLDRYGEVTSIAKKWNVALQELNPRKSSTLIVNGDDPELSYIAQESGLSYHLFGIPESLMAKKEIPHDVDFLYCPKSGDKLVFEKIAYSHMGMFKCPKCGYKHSKDVKTFSAIPSPLFGLYNKYNTNAALLTVTTVFDIPIEKLEESIKDFKPAFGRQEQIEYNGKNVTLLLSKNPTGFNQSIEAVINHSSPSSSPSPLKGEGKNTPPHPSKEGFTVLLVLNDRIPDGRDISWIWDVEFEDLKSARKIIISGDRTYDMALRMQYALQDQNSKIKAQKFEEHVVIEENLEKALNIAAKETGKDEMLFVLPTYSAMLETRKIISGKKIL